jgi:GT2 family glycosyltransferase
MNENSKMKVSLIIPYKGRFDNIKLLFESLANQTMAKNEFEAVVGVMEYCGEYTALCAGFQDRIRIISVMTGQDWQVAYARNIALKQAEGEVVVLLDADMVLGPHFLTNLYEKHFWYRPNQCVLGQMIDYDNNNADVASVEVKPYSFYQSKLAELESAAGIARDRRWQVSHHIPWAFAWTALIALPRKLLLERQLFFDQHFYGYGVEDLEWGYRICEAGIPIVLKQDVWGIHLPHPRNLTKNRVTERANYRYFLRKRPEVNVELTCAFGDFGGNNNYPEFKSEVRRITNDAGSAFAIINGMVNGAKSLFVGVIKNDRGDLVNQLDFLEVDRHYGVEILPLVGLSLPYGDGEFKNCYIFPTIKQFSAKFKDVIMAECGRVAKNLKLLKQGEANVYRK